MFNFKKNPDCNRYFVSEFNLCTNIIELFVFSIPFSFRVSNVNDYE